tara:strand:+ start:193 stop:297 length:105 start_codon:yes stop_codon:yes gene_type:complete
MLIVMFSLVGFGKIFIWLETSVIETPEISIDINA